LIVFALDVNALMRGTSYMYASK